MVSCAVAAIFHNIWWQVFILMTIGQFFVFYTVNQVYTNYLYEKIQRVNIELLTQQQRNIADVKCPCSENNIQEVDMRMDKRNTYKCSKCEKDIVCNINIDTAIETSPIYFESR